MKYIEGLYAFWDEVIRRWPDSFRINCASGGRRIDLEAAMRFHVHQKSDYWFDNVADQASLFGLSQYLPNGTVMAPLDRMDDLSFHSVLAGSLCLGWAADAEDFDRARARELIGQYRRIRHLLNGDWYPLTGYSRAPDAWLASQYHRPDLEQGLVLAFRREQCADETLRVGLRGVASEARYEVEDTAAGARETVDGGLLVRDWPVRIDRSPGSRLLVYRRVGQAPA
jgi:alpha-galactosidase